MAYPVIILGAGASHDYIDLMNRKHSSEATHIENIKILSEWLPPLANDLFDTQFEKTINRFPQIKNFASSIYSSNKDLETHLDELVEGAANKDRILKELISFECYLQDLFQKISQNYERPLNNYASLIRSVHNFIDQGNKVCFATFNYDTLLDKCLEEELNDKKSDINGKLPAYIDKSIKLVKLHGSCDWGHPLPDDFDLEKIKNKDELYNILIKDYKHLVDYRNSLNQIKKIPVYRTENYYIENEKKDRRLYLAPAIAIPLSQKSDFICPESHMEELKIALSETDKILIIGWKAGDRHLINIIKETIKRPVMITIVSKGKESIDNIKKEFNNIDKLSFVNCNQNGFSDFIQKDEHEKFLSIDPNTI